MAQAKNGCVTSAYFVFPKRIIKHIDCSTSMFVATYHFIRLIIRVLRLHLHTKKNFVWHSDIKIFSTRSNFQFYIFFPSKAVIQRTLNYRTEKKNRQLRITEKKNHFKRLNDILSSGEDFLLGRLCCCDFKKNSKT